MDEALIAIIGLMGTLFGVTVLALALVLNERIGIHATAQAVQKSTGQFKLLLAVTVINVLAMLMAVFETEISGVLPAAIPDVLLMATIIVVLQLLLTTYICGRWVYGVWRRTP